jgi:hypothetical protein
MAGVTHTNNGGHSIVSRKPESDDEWAAALCALRACPTSSIGISGDHDVVAAASTLPVEVEPSVLRHGYHSESNTSNGVAPAVATAGAWKPNEPWGAPATHRRRSSLLHRYPVLAVAEDACVGDLIGDRFEDRHPIAARPGEVLGGEGCSQKG